VARGFLEPSRPGIERGYRSSPRDNLRGTHRGLVEIQVIRIDAVVEGLLLVLRVAGSVSGADVAVLRDAVLRGGLPASIELSGVDFVDPDGAAELLALEARGTRLVGTPPFIELLLRVRPGSPGL
jgi:anti-anti-sigma regulatory factor